MGCYHYPHICFGWIEPYDKEIDCDTIDDISRKYDIDFRVFCSETNHNIGIGSIYGILCDFDSNTGIVTLSDEDKNKIRQIHNLWKIKNNIDFGSQLSFHLVISGDIDKYTDTTYNFDINE